MPDRVNRREIQSSRAHRNPTFGPASRTLPQLRVVARARLGGDSQPPPRRTWLAPALGERSETVSAYQSATHSSTLPLMSRTPYGLAPPRCAPTFDGRLPEQLRLVVSPARIAAAPQPWPPAPPHG